jgi:RNA polymerase sigma factor (TIGR02999 family)
MRHLPSHLVDQLTTFLDRWNQGDRDALWEVMPVLYDELHRRARTRLVREPNEDLLQATALVHELFLRLARRQKRWENEAQFLAICSLTMNAIVVEHARARQRQGNRTTITTGIAGDGPPIQVDILALHEALEWLRPRHPHLWMPIILHLYEHLTLEQIATCAGANERTVRRRLKKAKRLLSAFLTGSTQP